MVLIQPFFDVTQPIKGLIPLDEESAGRLKVTNARADRAREVRMHVMVATNEAGTREAKAFPMLKTSAPGTNRMPFHEVVALHPNSFPQDSYIYQKTIEVGLKLAEAAKVPHLYAAADWLFISLPGQNKELCLIGDFNCRGPGLWHKAIPSRKGFVEMLITTAKQNIARD